MYKPPTQSPTGIDVNGHPIPGRFRSILSRLFQCSSLSSGFVPKIFPLIINRWASDSHAFRGVPMIFVCRVCRRLSSVKISSSPLSSSCITWLIGDPCLLNSALRFTFIHHCNSALSAIVCDEPSSAAHRLEGESWSKKPPTMSGAICNLWWSKFLGSSVWPSMWLLWRITDQTLVWQLDRQCFYPWRQLTLHNLYGQTKGPRTLMFQLWIVSADLFENRKETTFRPCSL